MKTFAFQRLGPALLLAGIVVAVPAEEASVYYVCPGNVFTNMLSAKEAQSRGCKAREVQQPTTISGPRLRAPSGVARASDARIDAADQKARDSDARRILTDELSKQEDKLAALRKEYNDGQPDRLGDERNYQKYLDRVAELKASIARQESDVAAIRRELASLPQ
jgi:hypothetical protein